MREFTSRENARNKSYYYGESDTGYTVFCIFYRDYSKKKETAIKHFREWLPKQPFYEYIVKNGYIVNIENVCGIWWSIEIYSDLEMWEAYYRQGELLEIQGRDN